MKRTTTTTATAIAIIIAIITTPLAVIYRAVEGAFGTLGSIIGTPYWIIGNDGLNKTGVLESLIYTPYVVIINALATIFYTARAAIIAPAIIAKAVYQACVGDISINAAWYQAIENV